MTNQRPSPRRIAVIGGGISGLAAAYSLALARQAGAPVEEFLIEASDRLGGVIRTERVEGFVVEGGPDSFLAEKPEAAALCRELGLGNSLVGSNDRERRTYVLHQGRLVQLPDGFQYLIPTRLWPVLTTPLFTARGKAKMFAEWCGLRSATSPRLDASNPAEDESVASWVRRHFGDEMLENIADPLLAGVFGGDSENLSFRAVLPRFAEAERKYGGLIRAAREFRRQRGKRADGSTTQSTPLFMTLKDGLEQMVEALKCRLQDSCIFLKQRVTGVEPIASDSTKAAGSATQGYAVRCAIAGASRAGPTPGEDERHHHADAIILALPAYECAPFLAPLDPTLGDCLKAIPYTSALTVAVGYDGARCGHLPQGFGFLVPRNEKRRLLACTFVHNKFPHRAPAGKVLLRCFLGGSRDPHVVELGDEEILAMVRQELKAILNLSSEPLFYRIYRWPSSMPQYAVGHGERLKRSQALLKNHPGIFLAGNAYSGIGISDCIRSGKAAAQSALEHCGL